MITLAQVGLNVTQSQTNQTIWGLCGVLAIVSLVFAVILQAKKLFGRRPPIDDELRERSKKFQAQLHAVERRLDGRIDALEQRYEEMQLDRQRKWEELKGEYHELRETLMFIRGKFEALANAAQAAPKSSMQKGPQ